MLYVTRSWVAIASIVQDFGWVAIFATFAAALMHGGNAKLEQLKLTSCLSWSQRATDLNQSTNPETAKTHCRCRTCHVNDVLNSSTELGSQISIAGRTAIANRTDTVPTAPTSRLMQPLLLRLTPLLIQPLIRRRLRIRLIQLFSSIID